MIFSATRRKFLLISAGIASMFGITLQANSQPVSPPSPQPSSRPDGFVPIVGPANLLERNGKVLTDRVLIIRNSTNNQLVGVSPACPHRGCIVDWKQDSESFICPCHASEFGADGKVLKGPANQGLQGFEVKIENNAFLIKPIA